MCVYDTKTLLLIPVTFCAFAGVAALQAQPVLSQGHADVGIAYEDGAWDLHVHDGETDTEYEPDGVVIEVGEAGIAIIPADPRFSFLGDAGSPYWALPAVENQDLPFLGIATEEIESGVFEDDQVTFRLRSVVGPGDMTLFREDAFGEPGVVFDTRDGLDEADAVELSTGSHAHWTWAFSTAGTYRIGLEASGTLVSSGATVASGPSEYVFQVQPVNLRQGHLDLLASTGSGVLEIFLRDTVPGTRYRAYEVILSVAESAKLTLPPGTPFGDAGMPLWVLPQDDAAGLPYLGVSTADVPAGGSVGPVRYQLNAVEGPGDFFLWQADFGTLNVHMNSADGIDEQDEIELLPGGHAHFNWGFTAPGLHRVILQPVWRPVGAAVDEIGEPFPLAFHVEPMPTAPGFLVWQQRFWPTGAPETVQGPDADPDGDEVINALEYGQYGHPLVPTGVEAPRPDLVSVGDENHAAITFLRVKQAEDMVYEVVAGNTLPWNDPDPVTQIHSVSDQGEVEWVTSRDELPVGAAPSRFLQLRLRWKPGAGGTSH